MMLGPIGFTAPWLLLALAALPILWILLRAVPPAPIRRRFPGVALMLGLTDDDTVTDRTPWWLLLLRMLAVAALIVGLAGPVLNPQNDGEQAATGPLLIVLDGSWAAARDWPAQEDLLDAMLAEAGRESRPVAILRLAEPQAPNFQAAETWRSRLSGLAPTAWEASPGTMAEAAAMLGDEDFETRWFSDGLAREGRDQLLSELQSRGPVTVYESPAPVIALAPATINDGAVQLTATRALAGTPREVTIEAHGRDPSGTPRMLATLPLTFEADATTATGELSIPAELRARLTRFEIAGQRHAGAVTLTDDSLRRREIALIAGREDREGLELLSPLHYLEQALAPSADILDGALIDVLPANPDVIVLADVATLSGAEQAELLEWAEGGGLLLRFAGPRLAASDVSRDEEAPLMPVRLRAGGRTVGGAMSWGEPKSLAPFPEESPFFGLELRDDVTVSAQVMAQPDPTLASRVIAQLTDGTPLVTRKRIGAGQVVLFHVTANAEWSTLPLSGLFVQMLERLAVSSAVALPDLSEMQGTTWQPVEVLDGFGTLDDAGTLPGVDGEKLITDPIGPDLRPGLYEGPDRRLALNVIEEDTTLSPATWPANVPVRGLARPPEAPLGGWLLAAALVLLMADILASLALSGRLMPARAALILAALLALPQQSEAQEQDKALAAASEVVLAHVLTGDSQLDEAAHAGLRGLGETLYFRTSVEPSAPIGVNLEEDDLAL
ncbi:LytTR family transcriptional regulator, partial [Roseovarius sp. HI0049]